MDRLALLKTRARGNPREKTSKVGLNELMASMRIEI